MNEKTIENWIAISKYDIDTAEAMLASGRYLYVAYTCQQSIEKFLKAIYVKEKNITPPYTHNLRRLASELSVSKILSEDHQEFIDKLNSYYIESRYSEEIEQLSRTIDKNKAAEIFNKTNELLEWLKMKIT